MKERKETWEAKGSNQRAIKSIAHCKNRQNLSCSGQQETALSQAWRMKGKNDCLPAKKKQG